MDCEKTCHDCSCVYSHLDGLYKWMYSHSCNLVTLSTIPLTRVLYQVMGPARTAG